MERKLFLIILETLNRIGGAWRRPAKARFTDRDIVLTYFHAVLHERCVDWACRRENWPWHDRRRALPSGATMSRRLRTPEVRGLIEGVRFALAEAGIDLPATLILDAKPLPLSGHSMDKDAGFGRAGSIFTRGYKLHAIADLSGNIRAFRVESLKVGEQAAAHALLALLPAQAQGTRLLADANYDSSALYDAAGARGLQLVAARRYRHAKGLGHVYQSPFRLRALELQREDPRVLDERRRIEGFFGTMGNVVGGLAPLPNAVRGRRRVELWVAAKLAIDAAHRSIRAAKRQA
jgi:hypothetical protein